MSVINTNTSALSAQNSLRVTGLAQSTAMERLSSGIRINSAKDDAAGLAISTRMTANIRGISAAIRNANDGISLTQTAEGSLASIGDNLQRIRELAVQSANTGNNASDRAALNNEAAQLISEIDRIANNTNYNGIKLIDGSYKDQPLQVGAGNDSNDRIALSIGDAKTSRLGAALTAVQQGIQIADGKKNLEGSIRINGNNVGSTTSDGVSIALSEGSAIAKANAINAIANKTGVTAATRASTVTFTAEGAETEGASFKFLLNGVLISGSVQPEGADEGSASNIAASINAQTAKTGVSAEFGAAIDAAGTGRYTLTASDGRNIVLSTDKNLLMKAEGIDPAAPPAEYGGAWGTTGIDFGQTRWTSLMTGDLIEPSSTDGGNSRVVYGRIDLSTDSLQGITLGGLDATISKLGIEADTYAANSSAGSGVGSVNLHTSSGAQSALTTLDRAINAVTDMRAAMGAYQNRLAASISNLENTSMNLSASRSRILDTDYAKETTNLAKAQIIQQAATAMLAQANQSAQSVLALLK
jgi:flagellin